MEPTVLAISLPKKPILPEANIGFREVAEIFGNSATFLALPWTSLIIYEPLAEIIDWLLELV